MPYSADKLKINESAIILEVLESPLKINLLEMGFLPGKELRLLHAAPFNGPLAFKIDGTTLALRISEASLIKIKGNID